MKNDRPPAWKYKIWLMGNKESPYGWNEVDQGVLYAELGKLLFAKVI